MIVILSSEFDTVARWAASRWPGGAAYVMTPADLSCEGWTVETEHMEKANIVVEGRRVRLGEIRGWVNLLPAVFEGELVRVEAGDRRYAATEMSAFLTFLLTHAPGKVVNRPSPTQLNGPGWSHEKWILEAARAGLPVRRWAVHSHQEAPPPRISPLRFCTVLGAKIWGCDSSTTPSHSASQRLAVAANTAFLRLHFGQDAAGDFFLGANPVPPLNDPEMIDALDQHFLTS